MWRWIEVAQNRPTIPQSFFTFFDNSGAIIVDSRYVMSFNFLSRDPAGL
jgi:hypothetical protein